MLKSVKASVEHIKITSLGHKLFELGQFVFHYFLA